MNIGGKNYKYLNFNGVPFKSARSRKEAVNSIICLSEATRIENSAPVIGMAAAYVFYFCNYLFYFLHFIH